MCRLVIRHEGELLLTRSPKVLNEKWGLPGGHIEAGETIFETAVREGYEETGLTLSPVAVIEWQEAINPSFFHRPAHFICFSVLLDAVDRNLTLDDAELVDHCWKTPEEAVKMEIADSYKDTLHKYQHYLETE